MQSSDESSTASIVVDRADVLAHRFRVHQLDVAPGSVHTASRVAVLDYGVQDTGADGSSWAAVTVD